MLRSWLLMASVLCVFMTSGCGKKETPVAANTPPAASAPPSTPSISGGGGESSESSEAGGSIPPGGSDSYGDGSSANSGGSGYGGQGNVGYPGSSAGYPGSSAGYPGNSAGYPGGGMDGSEEESNNYGSGYPGGSNQGYGGPNQGQAGMQGQMGGNRGAARPNTPPPKPKKLTPKERATIAFEAGNMTRAYSLYHAHALSGDETQASEISDEMRWAARRPQIGLKVAVGLALKNPANVASGSLRPLGTDYQTIMGPLAGAAGGGRGMGGGPGAGGGDELGMGGMVSSGGPGFNGPGSGMGTPDGSPLKGGRAKALSDAAGTLAEKVIESFRDELSSGAFTVAFKDYPMTARPGAKFLKGFGPNMGAPGMGNGMGYPGGEGMGYPGGEGMGYPGGDGMGYPGGAGSDNPGYGAANSGYGGGMSTEGGSAPPGVPGGVRGGRQFFHFPQDEGGMPSRPSMPTAGTGSTAAPGRPTLGAPQGGGGVPGPMSGQDAAGQGFSGESGQGMEGQGFEGQGYGEPGYGGPDYGGQGAGGQGFPGQGLGRNGPNQLPPPPNISKEVRPPEGVTPLAACLHYIGSDEQSKLIKKAYDEGYDALLVFEVVINQNRQTTVVNNATRVKAIFPAETQKDAKVIASSKELVNVTVARANTKNENDGVEDAANLLVKKLVEAIALKEIPDKLTPEAVTGNRIPKLLKEEGLSKLEKLGEINFYYCKGFIDETQRDELYTKIAGKLAAQLMTGSEEEKEEALDELLGD